MLDDLLDEVIALIASAQQPDGYLNTHFTAVEPDKRWRNLRDCHELYCAGHMIEAGVAHFQATGKRSLLDVVCRYADMICHAFGKGAGQIPGYCGHEEIELALVKLYHATGEQRYLRQSEYFVNERGQQPIYFEIERLRREGLSDPFDAYFASVGMKWDPTYCQAHMPVREQRQVTGHAVRAMYLYSGMADIANETGDEDLLEACEALWEDVCLRKMYVTGGIGPSRHNEGFTSPYDLPNETAYAETCAAVGLAFWNHRLLQFNCDGRFADVIERTLYNGTISGISLDGKRFFYENPLASQGNRHRQDWFDCACCPPNLARLLASLGTYIYSQGEGEAAVHLFVQGRGELKIGGQAVVLRQETRYPWEGTVKIDVTPEDPAVFGLKLRLPGWCRSARLSVNGEAMDYSSLLERGYICLQREWKAGDQVLLELDMPVERVYAHPDVRKDAGQVALQRGPVVYCLEEVDQPAPVHLICLPKEATLEARFEPDLLNGVVTLTSPALAVEESDWDKSLYRNTPPRLSAIMLKAIPYYAWDNQSPERPVTGPMQVWIQEASYKGE